MMDGKTSFVLYHDIREPLEILNDAERGRLFLALLNYSEFGTIPKFSGGLQMAFAFIRSAIDRDAENWIAKRAKRSEAGRKGGQAAHTHPLYSSYNRGSPGVLRRAQEPHRPGAVLRLLHG